MERLANSVRNRCHSIETSNTTNTSSGAGAGGSSTIGSPSRFLFRKPGRLSVSTAATSSTTESASTSRLSRRTSIGESVASKEEMAEMLKQADDTVGVASKSKVAMVPTTPVRPAKKGQKEAICSPGSLVSNEEDGQWWGGDGASSSPPGAPCPAPSQRASRTIPLTSTGGSSSRKKEPGSPHESPRASDKNNSPSGEDTVSDLGSHISKDKTKKKRIKVRCGSVMSSSTASNSIDPSVLEAMKKQAGSSGGRRRVSAKELKEMGVEVPTNVVRRGRERTTEKAPASSRARSKSRGRLNKDGGGEAGGDPPASGAPPARRSSRETADRGRARSKSCGRVPRSSEPSSSSAGADDAAKSRARSRSRHRLSASSSGAAESDGDARRSRLAELAGERRGRSDAPATSADDDRRGRARSKSRSRVVETERRARSKSCGRIPTSRRSFMDEEDDDEAESEIPVTINIKPLEGHHKLHKDEEPASALRKEPSRESVLRTSSGVSLREAEKADDQMSPTKSKARSIVKKRSSASSGEGGGGEPAVVERERGRDRDAPSPTRGRTSHTRTTARTGSRERQSSRDRERQSERKPSPSRRGARSKSVGRPRGRDAEVPASPDRPKGRSKSIGRPRAPPPPPPPPPVEEEYDSSDSGSLPPIPMQIIINPDVMEEEEPPAVEEIPQISGNSDDMFLKIKEAGITREQFLALAQAGLTISEC